MLINSRNRIFLIIFCCCFFVHAVAAKVVYVVWMGQFGFYPTSNKLVSIDLESGQIINQKTFEDSYFNSISIDQADTNLYVSDINTRSIIQVDAKTLSITNQWNNLPASPVTVVFNETNNHLYFANTNSAGTGQDTVYQIDLSSNEISPTDLSVNGLDVLDIFTSKDKSLLIFKTYDIISNEQEYYSFNSVDMSLIGSAITMNLFRPVFNNEYFYGFNTQTDSIDAYHLTDGTLLWSTPIIVDRPVRFIVELNDDSLLLIDNINTYDIDKSNGAVIIKNDFSNIKPTLLIDINVPTIICITGSCSLSSDLEIKKFLPEPHIFENIFISEEIAGAKDYVFGNQNMAPSQIPFLNRWMLFVLITLLLVVTVKKKKG